MAVYRQTRRRGPPLLWIALGLVLLVSAGVAYLVLQPAPATERDTLRADLTELVSRLDVLAVEYPKQSAGQASGAPAALAGARAAWGRARDPLTRADAPAAQLIGDGFTQLEQKVAASAPPEQVTTQADFVRQQIRSWLTAN